MKNNEPVIYDYECKKFSKIAKLKLLTPLDFAKNSYFELQLIF